MLGIWCKPAKFSNDLNKRSKAKMAKYRSKPTEVEAVLWDGSQEAIVDITAMCNASYVQFNRAEDPPGLIVETMHGPVEVKYGDYIAKGAHDAYPIAAEVLAVKYEKID